MTRVKEQASRLRGFLTGGSFDADRGDVGESDVVVIPRDELADLLVKRVWERRQITVAEFMAAYRAGRLHDAGRDGDLIALAELLDDDDPVFSAA